MELALAITAPLLTSVIPALLVFWGNSKSQRTEKGQLVATSVAAAAGEWRHLYDAMNERVGRLERANEELQKRLVEQELYKRLLQEELDAVFHWIEGGMKPPPPRRPSFLKKGKTNV